VAKTTRVLILVALLVAAAPAFAQTIKDETVNAAVSGKITAVDTSARTLTVVEATGEAHTVSVDGKTTIMSNDKNIGLDGLHTGEWVAVDSDRRDGKSVATYIEVVDDPGAK